MNTTTRRMSTLLAAAGLAASLTVAGSAPTNAAAVTKVDAVGDAPARLDISKVTYRNAATKVSTRIRVPGLERRGQARFLISKYATDAGFEVTVRIDENSKLKKRFAVVDNAGTHTRSCAVTARWSASDNYISISVPQRCIHLSPGPLYVAAATGNYLDRAPVVKRLRRG